METWNVGILVFDQVEVESSHITALPTRHRSIFWSSRVGLVRGRCSTMPRRSTGSTGWLQQRGGQRRCALALSSLPRVGS